jgi:hypothetical protein
MKLASLLILSCFSINAAIGQVTSLAEDFDAECATSGTHYPLYWTEYNVIPPVTALAWACSPLGGRSGTPGMSCNSYYSGIHYLDTAWLFTPQLNLVGYNGNVFLRYDSKYEHSAAKLSVLVSSEYTKYTVPDSAGVDWTDLTSTITPVIGNDDSTDWVTHSVDLTPYKNAPVYVAFRYTSTTSKGGIWTLDNIMTTPFPLNIKDAATEKIPFSLVGICTREQIPVAFNAYSDDTYSLTLVDMVGREIRKESVKVYGGYNTYTITGLSLQPGIYCLRLSNGYRSAVIKVVIV